MVSAWAMAAEKLSHWVGVKAMLTYFLSILLAISKISTIILQKLWGHELSEQQHRLSSSPGPNVLACSCLKMQDLLIHPLEQCTRDAHIGANPCF